LAFRAGHRQKSTASAPPEGARLGNTCQQWDIAPAWLFWLLIVAMLSAAILNTAVLMISDARTRHADGTEPAPERIQPAN
jgi:hypothetical protein